MSPFSLRVGRPLLIHLICLYATALIAIVLPTSAGAVPTAAPFVSRHQLLGYIGQVERVRLPVNALLNGADPILDAYHAHRITPAEASMEMNTLEVHFAGYVLAMEEIRPSNATLARVNGPYARTYYLEDSYLSTLASDLNEGSFTNLPNTQDEQRLAIIVWRTQMELLARRTGITLPADLQQAGRGEIAPSPFQSSWHCRAARLDFHAPRQ